MSTDGLKTHFHSPAQDGYFSYLPLYILMSYCIALPPHTRFSPPITSAGVVVVVGVGKDCIGGSLHR